MSTTLGFETVINCSSHKGKICWVKEFVAPRNHLEFISLFNPHFTFPQQKSKKFVCYDVNNEEYDCYTLCEKFPNYLHAIEKLARVEPLSSNPFNKSKSYWSHNY